MTTPITVYEVWEPDYEGGSSYGYFSTEALAQAIIDRYYAEAEIDPDSEKRMKDELRIVPIVIDENVNDNWMFRYKSDISLIDGTYRYERAYDRTGTKTFGTPFYAKAYYRKGIGMNDSLPNVTVTSMISLEHAKALAYTLYKDWQKLSHVEKYHLLQAGDVELKEASMK